jgi:Tol biopolymer transport system component
MPRRQPAVIAAMLMPFIMLCVTGCQLFGAQSPPPSIWPSDAMHYEPTPVADGQQGPAAFEFMGDNPRYDHVPYENRSLTNVTQHTFTVDGVDFDPDLDTTGEELLFASTRHSVHPDIYIKHVDGTAMQQITSDPADDVQPKFSPDGELVAFSSNRSGNWDIWTVRRDGTELRRLTTFAGDEISPTWSPNGQMIAFTLWSPRARRWEVWTLDVLNPGVRRFLTYGMFPSWSPDGRKIAFQRARQRGTRWFSIWTVDLIDDEARHPTEVAYRPNSACIAPRWSPSGDALVYAAVGNRTEWLADESGKPEPYAITKASLWVVNPHEWPTDAAYRRWQSGVQSGLESDGSGVLRRTP